MDNSDENIQSAPEWYCRVSGKEWGPLSTDGLHNIARRGRLSPRDRVKNGVNGNWVMAESINGLFSQDEASPTTSQAAADLLAHGFDKPLAGTSGRTAAYRSPVRALSGVFDFVFTLLSAILNVGLSLVQRIHGIWIFLAILGALILTLVVSQYNPLEFRFLGTRTVYVKYQTLWTELKDKRKSQATPAEWEEFSERSQQELAPILEQLAKTAGPDDREALWLLQAGRDDWPRMLEDTSEDSLSENEQEFQLLLQTVETSMQSRNENWFIFVMIAFDVGVVLALAWWWKR